MWLPHTICRACGNSNLTEVFNFGKPMPLANDFKGDGESRQGCVPLRVLFCEQCSLSQLGETVSPEVLYADYPYVTSKSETMRQHFKSLWGEIQKECPAKQILEIGSNDGDFLEYARGTGADSVVGIDAAANLSMIANDRGITTILGVFDRYTSEIASRVIPQPDVIVARHVFAHVDDWQEFMRNLDIIAIKETLIVIEVPYVLDTLARVEFDQLYHEHLSYLSIKAMTALLETTPFRIHKVIRFPVHGGAVAIFIRRRDFGIEPDASVNEFLRSERITLETWKSFSKLAWDRICALKIKVEMLVAGGKKVVGYGASAKSTVWISACGFNRKHVSFIVDNTPQKQGKVSPGTDISVVPESELTNYSADYAVCFSWNFMPEIESKNRVWIELGGKFINPHEP